MIRASVDDQASEMLDSVLTKMTLLENVVSRRSAEWVVNRVKKSIYRQTLPFAPRSPNTHAADGRVLLDSHDYVRSMHVVKVNGSFAAACDAQKRWFAEYGRKGQPPRPHWGPAMLAFRNRGMKEVADASIKEVL